MMSYTYDFEVNLQLFHSPTCCLCLQVLLRLLLFLLYHFRFVVNSLRSTPKLQHWCSQLWNLSQSFSAESEVYCICPVLVMIWLSWDCWLTTSACSLRLPVTEIHCLNALSTTRTILESILEMRLERLLRSILRSLQWGFYVHWLGGLVGNILWYVLKTVLGVVLGRVLWHVLWCIFRAYFGGYIWAAWECAIAHIWEHTWVHACDCTWVCTQRYTWKHTPSISRHI